MLTNIFASPKGVEMAFSIAFATSNYFGSSFHQNWLNRGSAEQHNQSILSILKKYNYGKDPDFSEITVKKR